MSDNVITVENLSKSYLVGHESIGQSYKRYTALRDVIGHEVHNFARNTINLVRGRQVVPGDQVEEFWALKDVSFEVKRGEVLGIIRRNGAGKSTLLKILSRITEPTRGRVTLRGRVASLLEVGTGFHPELTGRENIYLNGAILGMTRAEIRRKFDQIVAFAEVEKFLDTPVKRYSSDMYVRLAFAVAAHLEPEILVVDEVLAVGDAEFQNKCLGKMGEVSKGGRTVLFVSHNVRMVTALCHRGILLNSGAVERDGPMSEVTDCYLSTRAYMYAFSDLTGRTDRSGSGEAMFQSVELLRNGEPCHSFSFGEPLTLRIRIIVKRPIGRTLIQATVLALGGTPVQELVNVNSGGPWVSSIGHYAFTVRIDEILLYPGTYSIDLWVGDISGTRGTDYIREAIAFEVTQVPGNPLPWPLVQTNGLVFQRSRWRVEQPKSCPEAAGQFLA